MLTKKKGEDANALLIDWRILENYNFYLDDLNIPLISFNDQEVFTRGFEVAVKELQKNFEESLWPDQKSYSREILDEVRNLLIPGFIKEEVIKEFCRTEYHGTTFLVLTPYEQLLQLSEKSRVEFNNDGALNYLRSSLSGLHNDLKNPQKDFEAHFYIYDNKGKYDVIDEFVSREEMQKADHWLSGEFDENGFFSGEIKIFERRLKHTFRPSRLPGVTEYGPFKIEWGFFEGHYSSSLLNEDQFRAIEYKLSKFGGLYVYRDDFRVLPYGRTEADFLEFEKRRTLGAGYYFFSHRRFIGYIDISREKNKDLKDKAGREGFIQNKAFREFKEDLIEFFVDIAKRYLRKGVEGEESIRQQQLGEIQAKYERQLKAIKKKNHSTKKAFIENFANSKERILPLKEEIASLEIELANEIENSEIDYNHYNQIVKAIDERNKELRNLKIIPPKGINISDRLKAEITSYQNNYFKVEDKIQSCVKLIDETRQRFNSENLKSEYNSKFKSHLKSLEKQFAEFENLSKNSIAKIVSLLNQELNSQTNGFIEQTERIKLLESDSKEEIAAKIRFLEKIIEDQNKEIDNSIKGFINHISNLQIDLDDDFLRNWYQDQNENLEKRLRDYEELAQLGMSIEIIDHQFNVMYSQMNDAVHEFDRYARKYPEMEFSFKQLRNAFQHLEGNYKLLKPLYRTSRRTREVITGSQIEGYIKEFFANEFQRYRIDFSVNDQFRGYEFFTYDSIIKPVFLNLINNANYWLTPVKDRKIRIEFDGSKILIMNSGERIEDGFLEDIFTLFFTRKRDGRGIGLHLAKKNLSSIGYDIYATNEKEINKLKGACFVIKKIDNSDES